MLKSLGAIAEDWLRLDGRKRLIVDDEGTLLWISRTAAAALAEGPVLRVRNGRLFADDAADAAALAGLLQADAPEAVTMLGRDDDAYHVLRRWQVHGGGEGPLHLIEFRTAGDVAVGELAGFDVAFGLTPTEATVVRELVAGKAVEALADAMAISRETVRTHIRRIYSKTAVKSREELFARLRPFVFG